MRDPECFPWSNEARMVVFSSLVLKVEVVPRGFVSVDGQRAINSKRSAFHIRAAIFLIIPGIQKAKQSVECRASDGYSINYDASHPCRHPVAPFPLFALASFSMTHESTADKIASYLRSLFFRLDRKNEKKGN